MSLTFLGKESVIKIPFFQRGYVWDKTNWEDLLADLYDQTKNTFLGSLILKQLGKPTGKSNVVLVIDGQQRLTTLCILLKALYESFSDELKINCKSLLETYLFYKEQATDKDHHIKINHSQLDSSKYEKIINDKITKDELDKIVVADNTNKISSSDSKILQCYKYFIEALKSKTEEENKELFNRLSNNDNKIIVIIDLSDKDDEQNIFDTINSAGVRLSGADIIKNSLFQRALDLIEKQEDVVKLYNNYWESIFSYDEYARTFWDTLRSTGRLMRDNIEILLHSIAVILNFFDPDKHTLSDLPKLYKNYINSLDINTIVDFIKLIAEYAELYRENILSFDESSIFAFENNYQRLFHILDKCEITTFHPYLLSLFYKYKKNDDTLNNKLLLFEKFIVRRIITKKETKNYNKICKEFIKDDSILNAKVLEIEDETILSSLENITNKNAKVILFWIELYRRYNDKNENIKELKYNYQLEHLMPQKWEEYWSSVTVYDGNMQEIKDFDKAKIIRNKVIYSIGNMTLLNSALNVSLRNYPFVKKMKGEGKMKGIKNYSDLKITKDDIVISYEQGNTTWDERNIYKRTKELGREIISIW